jgi:hypothetical protein
MSAGLDSFTKVTVYVRLLEEGTSVWRPTEAVQLANGLYELLPTPDYDPEDEKWEFPPGSIVRVEKRQGSVGEHLLAVAGNK